MNKLIACVAVFGCVVWADSGIAEQPQNQTGARAMMGSDTAEQREMNQLIRDASSVYQRFLEKKPANFPSSRIRSERACISVVPKLTSTALVVGVTSGQGIVSCKAAGTDSKWSPPAFFKMSSQSLGAQLGRESSEVISYVIGERAGENFIKGETFKLGAETGVTAGGTGGAAAASASTGTSYVLNKSGAYLGASLSGSSISPDMDAIHNYYGREASTKGILFDQKTAVSPDAQRFIDLLSRT